MAYSHSERSLPIAVDPLKEVDNVLILFPDSLTVATVPPSEATRLASKGLDGELRHSHWDIPLDQVREFKCRPGEIAVTYIDINGRDATLRHVAPGTIGPVILEQIQRGAPRDWDEERGRASPGGTVLTYWGLGIGLAVVSTLLYFGIEAGWINRAPAIIAGIHGLLGSVGILVVGGLCAIACFVAGIKAIIAPGEAISLRRRD